MWHRRRWAIQHRNHLWFVLHSQAQRASGRAITLHLQAQPAHASDAVAFWHRRRWAIQHRNHLWFVLHSQAQRASGRAITLHLQAQPAHASDAVAFTSQSTPRANDSVAFASATGMRRRWRCNRKPNGRLWGRQRCICKPNHRPRSASHRKGRTAHLEQSAPFSGGGGAPRATEKGEPLISSSPPRSQVVEARRIELRSYITPWQASPGSATDSDFRRSGYGGPTTPSELVRS